jgi:hypothetical protein
MILETAVERTRVCFFWVFRRGVTTQTILYKIWQCLQGGTTTLGSPKKCAILNVATFTHRVNLELVYLLVCQGKQILKFFNEIIILAKLGSAQLPFLG